VDAARIAVAGDSAGGNLATVTALRVRDEGGPRLCGQLLVYPSTDAKDPPKPSAVAYGKGYLLTLREIHWFREHDTSNADDLSNPLCTPMLAQSLAGLPLAFVITAEFDPMRDEGELYAERLREEGVSVVHRRVAGMTHAFFTMNLPFPEIRRTHEEACAWLRECLFDGGSNGGVLGATNVPSRPLRSWYPVSPDQCRDGVADFEPRSSGGGRT
jgi:acetyl esterase